MKHGLILVAIHASIYTNEIILNKALENYIKRHCSLKELQWNFYKLLEYLESIKMEDNKNLPGIDDTPEKPYTDNGNLKESYTPINLHQTSLIEFVKKQLANKHFILSEYFLR